MDNKAQHLNQLTQQLSETQALVQQMQRGEIALPLGLQLSGGCLATISEIFKTLIGISRQERGLAGSVIDEH